MSNSTSNKTDFTTGSIFKKLTTFMIPILLALILQAMYGAVDILIVGHFGTTAGISGVNTGSIILNFVTFSITAISMGITVIISQYLGQKRPEKIGKVIGGAIAFLASFSVLLATLLLIFAEKLAILVQTPPEALSETVTYIRICGGGIAFVIAYNVISGIFRGIGNSNLPLIFVAISCLTNIVGDLLLVAYFNLNVAGAAIATVFAQALSVMLSLAIIKRQKLPFKICKHDIRFNSEILKFLKIGSPIALQEIFTGISFTAICAFINNLGLAASSGYGIANKIVSFILLVPSALMQSMSAFVGQNVGAGLEKRAKKAMFEGMLIGSAIGVLVIFLIFFYGENISRIFTPDSKTVNLSTQYLKGFAIEAVVTSILFSFIGYYNGHGKTLFVMLQGIAQTFIIRLPFSYYMSIQPDASLLNIGLAAPSATIFGILINLAYFIFTSKKRHHISLAHHSK